MISEQWRIGMVRIYKKMCILAAIAMVFVSFTPAMYATSLLLVLSSGQVLPWLATGYNITNGGKTIAIAARMHIFL